MLGNEVGCEVACLEIGIGQDLLEEGNGRLDATYGVFIKSPFHDGPGFLPVQGIGYK